MLELDYIIGALKLVVFTSVVFVRYDNLSRELVESNYSERLIKSVNFLNISGVLMMQAPYLEIMRIGCLILIISMASSIIVKLKLKYPVVKILPSLTLLSFSIIILLYG